MSVVGVDFGALNTVIAVARNRGVDVITNEVSNRATPSLVGFGPKSRYIGEPAKTQEISNLKNTVGCLKRLAGRTLDDPDVAIEQQFISATLVDVNGEVGAEVTYLGEKRKFSATELIAMFMSKIKQTTQAEVKVAVQELVLSVPAWFTDKQRRSILDAAEIAGLRPLRLINDTTAAALGWGITKLDLPGPEEKPRRVAFVDVGYSNYTCSIVEFKKGELSVKSTACDRHFGGRNFDKALLDHLHKEFLGKYKIDIFTNPKAVCRVLAAAEKLKKILSANQQAPLNIESLMNDIDVRAMITRQEFEAMVEPLLAKVHVPLEQALADAKLTKDDIDIIEVVGGGSRVPSVKERIQAFFGKQLSFTMNQDEAIARGCAFSCAILSPVFKVRDFQVQDIINYPIEFTWEKDADIPDEDTSLVVFNKGNVLPSTKILTFYRKQPFDLEARYTNPEELPGKTSPFIGRFSIKGVHATEGPEDFMICKLKARINIHGILNVESAYYVEDQEVEEEVKDENGDVVMEGDKPKTRKVKKQVRKGELPVVSATPSLDPAAKNAAIEREQAMIMEDKLVADTEEKKNELETYIYDLRNKLDDQYADLASEEEKEKIRAKLMEVEDWLYDEGDDATKAVYVAKIEEIRALAGPVVQRYFDKVEAERQALQEKLEAEKAAKKAEEEARKAKEAAEKAAQEGAKDDEMTDADAPKPVVEEA
ncbi:heat shock protein 88, variant [Neurospora crassa OR74A]|uniref:Heat shock protein hsp88 n=1 Tax=Neurospora crassa (strain ATCC 24698 / 74-OR23-1A / CBS 708.71 / DSM 1257 / FGSC 987) TaxID=367110 RepID=HSP88_NEUCR|nr:heat shock protein 88 [Neurospora crassa OR74A]XP_011394151.1 heat shock protein 88, variant [Neurospora crassa OR74A]O74225.1 RecName: Full=Heat shock protein hsp88 [Neurospora crassa OR74A]AAC23862.1 heat shock protein Hsp88 [Neurospora crassa]ESA43073.1 heat shock protein 88 [Neurospora crassa OR74A]ESA43074.1 heat shock protein 88, variant [Neurospora crassa OR74A]|eukprot:XP_011394150.1 heat shock protein 88 [Neurospora crassa OR74A]